MVTNLNDPYISKALEDPDTRILVIKSLDDELSERGRQLLDAKKTTISQSSQIDLISILSAVEFPKTPTEVANVYRLIINSTRDINIPPYVIDHLPQEQQWKTQSVSSALVNKETLGRRCFIACGLFRKALEYRSTYKGAPKPSFYRDVGQTLLEESKMPRVSSNFDNWTDYLHENLSSKN